jgi:NTP pyrophosphatase (non-canonical NTP hydrolase)
MGDQPMTEFSLAAHQLAAISQWVDDANVHRDPEAQRWERLAKPAEEAGEVISALIGLHGSNPRKGITHDVEQVRKELLDTAVAALGALEHLNGNDGSSLRALADFIGQIHTRAGLPPAEVGVR